MRIIIIDDHKIFGEGLASLLSSIDLEVVRVFQEPKIALEYLKKVNDVDIVFTDINMPGFNGFKICEEIKLRHIKIKTIAMSMYDDSRIKQQAIKSGANIYLTKTATKEEISEYNREYNQTPNVYGIIGLTLIIAGVVLLNLFGKVK